MTMPHEPLEVFPTPEPPAAVRRAPKRLMAAIALGNFGIWIAFFSPVVVAFPVKIDLLAPGSKEVTLSVVLGISTVVGLLSNPVIGRLSDRSLSRFGRRRPWILGSTILGVIGMVVMGASTNVPVFAVGAVLSAIAFAGALSVLLSLIPEHFPPTQQGGIAGLIGVTQALGATVGIIVTGALLTHLTAAFIAPSIVGLIAVLVLCVVLKDRAITAADRPTFTFRQFWGSFWTSPRKHPDFGWAWLSRFAIFLSFASVINYQVYYLTDRIGTTTAQAAALVPAASGLESLMLIITAIIFGRLSDRLQRRRPFVFLASAIGAVGTLVLAFNGVIGGFLLSLAIVGIAQGIYYSVDLAMVAQILPNKDLDAGKDFGVFSIASNLPQTLAPFIAPLFLSIGAVAGTHSNYTALFLASAVYAVVAGVAALRIRGVR